MTEVSNYIQQQGVAETQAGRHKIAKKSASGDAGFINFMDLIFARMAGGVTADNIRADSIKNNVNNSDKVAKTVTSPVLQSAINITELSGDGEDNSNLQISDIAATIKELFPNILEDGLKETDISQSNIINSDLTVSAPQIINEKIPEAIKNVKKLIELQKKLDDSAFTGISATDFSIENLSKEDLDEIITEFIAYAKITQPDNKIITDNKAAEISSIANLNGQINKNKNSDNSDMDNIAENLNNIAVGAEESGEEFARRLWLTKGFTETKSSDISSGFIKNENITNSNVTNSNVTALAQNSNNLTNAGDILGDESALLIAGEEDSFSKIEQSLILPRAVASESSNLTNLLTQTGHASQAHPASRMIAAELKKSVENGIDTVTLELDPPELGRVRIKILFDDGNVKANMTVEKPDTYMMLQRDAQILERALQVAGIDSAAGSISFDLMENGDFDNKNGNGNEFGSSKDGNNNHEGQEIIETTMNWYIDDKTGLQRYDLLV